MLNENGFSTGRGGKGRGRRGRMSRAQREAFHHIPQQSIPFFQTPQEDIPREQKIEVLKEQKKLLEERINDIMKRIDALFSGKSGKAVSGSVLKASVDTSRCTGCGTCIDSCPEEAIRMYDKAEVTPSLCTGCGRCMNRCPQGAITLSRKVGG